jgi:heme/copper-type cytochrome/quinol oxidase subunit 4
MKRWHNLVVLALSIAITALAIVVVWPGAPERYLPRLHTLAKG